MAYQQILPADTELIGEFQILSHLGSGGFANTYHALEKSLGREVAIKEYFPSDLAVRADNAHVEAKTPADEKHFKWGLRRFIREAQTLAKFRHPSVVRVLRVFEENDTAYIVMEFVSGSNMEAWLHALERRPTQPECDHLLAPLLDALEVVHSAGILHRDIKPANIYIRAEDSSPVLLDFGSARHAVADQAGTTAAIVSKGYSPHEAYTTDTKQQGPWSDIYGLAATIYRALSGSAPPESTRRMLGDTYNSSTSLPATQSGYRPEFLDAIDAALKVMPGARPQSISDWRKQLFPSLPSTTIAEGHAPSFATTKIWKPISDDFSDSPSSASVTKEHERRSGLYRSRTLAFRIGLALSLIGGAALYVALNPASVSYVQDLLNNSKQAKVSPQPDDATKPQTRPKVTREVTPTPKQTPRGAREKQRVKSAEAIFWESIDRDNPNELQAYLDAYPDGKFVILARIRLNKIEQAAAAAATTSSGKKSRELLTTSTPPVHDCDKLAAHPGDPARKSEGVDFNQMQADDAETACRRALEVYPGTTRFEYQLGRALHHKESYSETLTLYRSAADKDHAAAMHGIGRIYDKGEGIEKDARAANRWFRKSIEKGFPTAMINLANNLLTGDGIKKDQKEAFRWYRKAADMGIADAMYGVGLFYHRGWAVQKSVVEANHWYRKAAEKGSTYAMVNLGNNLRAGAGIARSAKEAERWYRKAAYKGNANAMHNLGAILQYGRGITRDVAEANRWYRKGADKGNADAMYKLGVNLENGRGFPRDYQEANRWYRKAAEKGSTSAMVNLGLMFDRGLGVAKDQVEANRWYSKAAEKGNTYAMYNLGLSLARGQGIAKDEAAAFRWFRKAAKNGNTDGMYSLGVMYNRGYGIAKDKAEAGRWYRKAADKGHPRAMYNLAVKLTKGSGIAKDKVEANRWYRKAADKGHANAMYNLALNLAKGSGIAKDKAEAVRWYRKAADKGQSDALYQLAMAYDDGLGVTRDRREAARFMVEAIKRKNAFVLKQMTTNSAAWSKEFRRELQRLVRDAGVYNGAIDGSFGPSTRRAMEALAKQ